jgi:type I restriction enzyme, S subunit
MNETIQIPNGWELKKISDICEKISSGGTPDRQNSDYFNGNIPWVKMNDMKKDLILDTREKITQKGLNNSSAKILPKNTILLAMYTEDMGRTSILGVEGTTNQAISALQVNSEIIPKYLFYFLKSQKKTIDNLGKGGAQPNINQSKVKNLQILFPKNKKNQERIVQKLDDMLGQVNKKRKEILYIIEKNKQRINFFEKNWINYKISTLISRKKLPEEWSLIPLSEICIVERGRFGHRPRNDPDYYGGKYPFIQTGTVARSNGRVTTYSQTLNEKGFKTSRMFPKGTVVITIAANIGDTAILEFDTCMPDSLIGITPIIGKTTPEYIEYTLRLYQKELTHNASEGSQKNINYKFLKPLLIPIPKTIDIQNEITQNIKSAEKKFQSQKVQFENIKQNYENTINHINKIQLSILDTAFSGKLVQ